MAKDLLFEIGLEEVPARFLRAAMEQLKEKTVQWLEQSRLSHGAVEAYATPRRLSVLVHGVAEKQEDVEEEVKGPSRKIAQDENGNWSKAALGFARGQGVDPEQFTFKELNGVEYIYVTKSSTGVDTASILAEGLLGILSSMNFPKNMRWGSYDYKFVRPIRWLVAMFGSDVIDLEVTGCKIRQRDARAPFPRNRSRAFRCFRIPGSPPFPACHRGREGTRKHDPGTDRKTRAGEKLENRHQGRFARGSAFPGRNADRIVRNVRSVVPEHSAGSANHVHAGASALFPGA